MALLDRILPWRKTETRAIDALPWDVGGPLRPAAVSTDQALSLVPVFGAVRLLATQVASLPLQTYRKTGDTRTPIPSGPLFTNPSVNGTLYDWLHRCMTSLALRGNAFGYITGRDRDQYPTMIEWLHPDDVRVDDRGMSGPGSYAQPVWYWQGRIVPAEDLLHIPWFTVPGRILGLSPIGACAATISTGISAQNYTSDWFDSGAVPPGEFKNTAKTVNQTEADIISARLNAAIKRRKPLVYGNDWEYKPIAVAAHEAKFIETMRLNATQVATIYGIPPEMIGGQAGGPLTYNTVELNASGLEKFTLRPWLTLLEAAFYRLMPRPQYVKFNVDSLLRTDLQTRMASYQVGRTIGLYNIDEARALEDMPPLPNGEGQDYTPLQIAASRANQPATAVRYWDAEYVEDGGAGPKGSAGRHLPGLHDQSKHGRRAWLSSVVNLAAGVVRFGAGDDNEVSIGHGDHHVWLSESSAGRFARHLEVAGPDYEVGWKRFEADYPDNRSKATSYAEIHKTGPDEYTIDLSEGDGKTTPETVALFTVTGAEANALGAEMHRVSAARKADTSAGSATVVLERDGRYTVELPATGGKPITLNLSQTDAEELGDAIARLIGEIDEFPIDAAGNPIHGPDDVVASRTVRAGAGTVTISAYGQYGSGTLVFESSQHDWVLRLRDTEAEDIGSALQESTLIGGPEDRSGAGAFGALADLHVRRDDPTDPAGLSADLPDDWDPSEPDPDRVEVSWAGPELDADDLDVSRAAPDGLKGGARLKWYWTKGPGLAKWATKAHRWTALYRHLLKYMPPGKAKRTAAAWFHSVFGYWPGHQKGKNPVGPRSLGAEAMVGLQLRRADPFDPATLAADARHLPGKHNQLSHGRPGVKGALKKAAKGLVKAVIGRDVTGDPDLLDSVKADSGRFRSQGDPLMGSLASKIGFDGPPSRVTSARMKQEIDKGGVEAFRGVQPVAGKSAKQIVADYKSGDPYYGLGRGKRGNGIYFSTDFRASESFKTEDSDLLRIVLRSDAKTIDHEDLIRRFEAHHGHGYYQHESTGDVLDDPGRFAMALGYDAIIVDPSTGDWAGGRRGELYVIVLNRTATLVEA